MNATAITDVSIAISVVVPVFQDADGIRACLEGLARQSIPAGRIEVVVVDNGSRPPIVLPQTSLAHLRLVQCGTAGSYAARNAGVRVARGAHLAFTDADCVPDPHWLENGIGALQGAGVDVIVGGEVRMLPVPRPTAVALYQSSVGFQQAANIGHKGFSVTANLFCSRQAIERVGLFDEALLSGGDREWCWRAERAGIPVVFAPRAIVATSPRTTLRAAIRQARRVVAGRHQLRRSGLAGSRTDSIQPHRGVLASLSWIMTRRELGWFGRLRVLLVAVIIKLASWLEIIRIRLGGRAERR